MTGCNVRWRNKAEKSAEVLIYGEIGSSWFSEGIQAKDFADALNGLGDIATVNVRINSPGGSVLEAQGIYNTLVKHPARVEVDVDGAAFSSASWIVQAGDVRRMAANGRMLIHEAQGGVLGTAGDMRREADLLDSLTSMIAGIYADRSGKPVDSFREAMATETLYTPEDAKNAGLIDEITPNKRVNLFGLAEAINYKHADKLKAWLNAECDQLPELANERARQIRAFQVSRGLAKSV